MYGKKLMPAAVLWLVSLNALASQDSSAPGKAELTQMKCGEMGEKHCRAKMRSRSVSAGTTEIKPTRIPMRKQKKAALNGGKAVVSGTGLQFYINAHREFGVRS